MVARKAAKVTVFSNALGKLPALVVIKMKQKQATVSVEAEDDKGTPYIGAALKPGEAIAITVPATGLLTEMAYSRVAWLCFRESFVRAPT